MTDTILPTLARLSKVPLREVWQDEARIFTPWLEKQENLDLLAESLGLPPLEIRQREQPVGRYSADLVCRITDTGDYLLVENQIEISDHRHLGQLLTYIAGLESQGFHVRYVAWLAEDFRDEHRSAVEWLNDHLDENIGFFACRIEVWKIGSSPDRAPRFDLVVEPRQVSVAPARASRRTGLELDDSNRVAYWAAFSDELRKRNLPLRIRDEPPRIGYYTFTLDSGRGLYLYAYRNVSDQQIGAYINIAQNPAPAPQVIFDKWFSLRSEIETQFGEQLDWQEVEAQKHYRIQVRPVHADPLNEADWPRQHTWLSDRITSFYRVFSPLIVTLPTRPELLSLAGTMGTTS